MEAIGVRVAAPDAPFVRNDRYYIIKDNDENYYKVRFTAMTQNGERGHVGFEYALVKSSD